MSQLTTHEKHMQQAKYKEKYIHQAKCQPCNKPNVMTQETWTELDKNTRVEGKKKKDKQYR